VSYKTFSRVLSCSLCLCAGAFGGEQTVSGHKFTLPDGFVVERVAGPPLVDRPIHASFDELGRLYVVESSGTNDKPEKQLAEKPHRAVRLEDSDGDGLFDKSVVFADKLMFPEGCLWFRGSLYVGAPPSIWKLTDTNDDGVADERVEWWQGKTLTGCANDLHGPYAGPDGWLYWTKGAFAKQTHERPGRKPFVTRAAHIYRSRPDGSDFEAVMTGGMDNPVEVAFNSEGEMFLSTTFFQHPEDGRRDGLIHVIHGGVYGKEHDPIEEHPRTGGVMPVLSHLGAAAPAGLACDASGAFGEGFKDNLFAALFNMRKVTRHELTPDGSTYRSKDSDFLVSDNNDFHPTDVLEDPQGGLIVVDTGGWYKLCCPTSQLAKPDVLGAVYRVRRNGALKADAVRSVSLPASADTAVNTSIRTAGLERDRKALDELHKRLDDPMPLRKRLVAQALGRLGDPRSVPKLLGIPLSLEKSEHWDRPLEHAVIHALIEIADPAATRQGLESPDARVKRCALIALDQMENGGLKAEHVLPFLSAKDPLVSEGAMWIASRHADWGSALVGYFGEALSARPPRSDLPGQLARFGRDPAIQGLLIKTSSDSSLPIEARQSALGAMARTGLKEMPADWARELARLVGERTPTIPELALEAIRACPAPKAGAPELTKALVELANDARRPAGARLSALSLLPGGLESVDEGTFDFLRAHLDPSQGVSARGAAARVLAKAKLSDAQLKALLDEIKKAGPLEISKLLEAFTPSKDEALGLALVDTLKEAESLSSLHADWIKPVLANQSEKVREKAEEVYTLLQADRAQQKTRLESLLAQMKGGDVRRGQAIFNSEKTACRVCHAMGYHGGRIGPDMTRIGEVRTERDLLESLLYPSASFVRSYEPFVVVTKSGEVHNGLIKKDAPDEIILTTGALTEARVERSEIAEIRPSTVSVMPQGLEQQLTIAELADLLAFLKSTKWGPQ